MEKINVDILHAAGMSIVSLVSFIAYMSNQGDHWLWIAIAALVAQVLLLLKITNE